MATALRAGSKAVTTAGTAEKLVSAVTMAATVTVQSKSGNTGKVYVGSDSTIAGGGKGFTLYNPGDSVVLWRGSGSALYDLSGVWLDAAVNGEGVDYIALVP